MYNRFVNQSASQLYEIKKTASIFMKDHQYEAMARMPADWVQVMYNHKHKVHDLFFFHSDIFAELLQLRSDYLESFFQQANLNPGGNAKEILRCIISQATRPVICQQPLPQPVYAQPYLQQPVFTQPYPQPVYSQQPVYMQPQPQPVYASPAYPMGYAASAACVQSAMPSMGNFGLFGKSDQHHHHHDHGNDHRPDIFR